jgi:cadmium resistance transport/sequestration family protein
MSELVSAISTGIVAFTATNIDDILILLLFFSQVNSTFTRRQIIAGQYLGFTALVIASLPGLFGGLVLPPNWIGLLGLIPIAIGISSLVNQEEDSSQEAAAETEQLEDRTFASFISPQTYSVAAITIANGSDNISVYIPLFASTDLGSFLVIIAVFFLLIGVWCYSAYKLTHQTGIADILTQYGSYLVPFVLIGLGTFIVLKSDALNPIKLLASCLCVGILVKDDNNL